MVNNNAKLNILLVSLDNSDNAKIGGKHIHQELLKRGWIECGHNVDIIYPNGFFWFFKKVIRKVFQITKIISDFNYFKYSVLSDKKQIENKVYWAIKSSKYDFISVQDVVAAFAVKKILKNLNEKIPVVLTLHGYFARESVNYAHFSEKNQNRVLKFGLEIEKNAIEFVSGIITVDTRIKEYVCSNFKFNGPIEMICNSIDNSRFFPVDFKQRSEIRKKLNLNSRENILLVARRLVKKNGVIYAVEAMNLLKNDFHVNELNLKLLIVGRGPEQAEIENYIISNNIEDCVKVVGLVEHKLIDQYYKCADIILMPSTLSNDIEEATSLSMLEGLACGKVVIASSIGGLKEVITNNVNGVLVPDKNPRQIADSIVKVLTNTNFKVGLEKNAFEYAEQNCGYLNHSKKFITFYFQNFSKMNLL